MKIKLDMHIHSLYSHDGTATVEEIVALAKAKGMNALTITDHDSLESYQTARLFHSKDFFVIPAVEYSTTRGHILVYFVDIFAEDAGICKNSDRRYLFEDIIRFTHEHGGLAFAAHMFKHARRPLSCEPFRDVLNAVDGLEIYNGRCSALHAYANTGIQPIAQELARPFSIGSDGHAQYEMFRAYRILEFGEHEDITFETLKKKIAEPCGSYFAHPTPACFITYTKLRLSLKDGHPKRIIKYMLHLCYCLPFDLIRLIRNVFTGELNASVHYEKSAQENEQVRRRGL